jgi:hypothetical protein
MNVCRICLFHKCWRKQQPIVIDVHNVNRILIFILPGIYNVHQTSLFSTYIIPNRFNTNTLFNHLSNISCNFELFWSITVLHINDCMQEYTHYSTVKNIVINHCDRCITHLGDFDISFVLLNISSKFLLHSECYLLSHQKAYQNK